MPIQAIFFDLDNTLLDGSPNQGALLRTCDKIAAANPPLDPARLLEANSEVWRAYWPGVEAKWTLGVLDGNAVSLEAWRRTLRTCGCDDESLAQLATAIHWEEVCETCRLFDDVQELFSLLKSRLPLALITNGASDTQRGKLRVLGIENYFGTMVISGEHGLAKPDPAIFRIALDALGLTPKNVWHIGDSLPNDVGGANGAGLTSVWLNRIGVSRTDSDPVPHHEIATLSELSALLNLKTP